jgi:hypothetical protein
VAAQEIASLDEQIRAMRATYPRMGLVAEGGWGAVWEGPLVGFERVYTVRVSYFTSRVFAGCDLSNSVRGPEAYVIEPNLLVEMDEKGLPHVYGYTPFPKLCLFDPETDDWRADMLLSETFVPWAAQWLAFYEIWQVTGRWTGPERHPEPQSAPRERYGSTCPSPAMPSAGQEQRVADWLGSRASVPLVRAAAARRLPSLAMDW